MKKEPMNAPAQNYVSPKAKEYKMEMESSIMSTTGEDDDIIIHNNSYPEE